MYQFTYIKVFGNFLITLKNHPAVVKECKDTVELGKLSIVKDPELKYRVIAMLDYNSQIILKPIHTIILNLLKKLPQDRTYTQDPHNI